MKERWLAAWAVAALAGLPASTASGQGAVPIDEAGFTRYVAERVRKEAGGAPVSVKGPLTLAVGELQANLDRIFGFCRTRADACEQEVTRYVEGVAEHLAQARAPLDRASVRMVIRDAGYIQRAQGTWGTKGPVLLVRPLVSTLVEVVVADTPSTVQLLDQRALGELKVSRDEIFALARANVRASLTPLARVARPVGPRQLGSITGSVYEVSRVAAHEDWAELAQAQQGALIVAMPATDLVLHGSEDSRLVVDALRTVARDAMGKVANPLSADVLKWSPTGWVPAP